VDEGPPFNSIYITPLAHRSPEALGDTISHMGSYLFHELTTPLGLALDHVRRHRPAPGDTPFRSFGTFGVWFPRGLLLRRAARLSCRRLIEEWMAKGTPDAPAEVEAACAKALADPGLRPEALAVRLEEAAAITAVNDLSGTPAQVLTALLTMLEEQS